MTTGTRLKVGASETATAVQAVALIDPATGTAQSVGGGTQYTEDAAAAANPIGNAIILRRKDTLSDAEVSADGDNIALNGTAKGEAYVHDEDAGTLLAAIQQAAEGTQAAVESTTTVNVAPDSSVMMLGASQVTPKFARFAVSSSGDNPVVAAVTDKKIRVLAFRVNGDGDVTAEFQINGTATGLSGPLYITSGGQGEVGPFCPVGLFETTAGAGLDINLGAAVAVGGYVVYIEV